MKKYTKKEKVLMYLKEFGSITSLDAIREFDATRLAAIIYDLKKEGYEFEVERIPHIDRYGDKVSYAKYTLKK